MMPVQGGDDHRSDIIRQMIRSTVMTVSMARSLKRLVTWLPGLRDVAPTEGSTGRSSRLGLVKLSRRDAGENGVLGNVFRHD